MDYAEAASQLANAVAQLRVLQMVRKKAPSGAFFCVCPAKLANPSA